MKNINLINKPNLKIEKILTLIIIFTFCIPGEIRTGIFGRTLGLVNYVSVGLIIYLTIVNIRNFNKKYLIFVYLILLYYVATFTLYENKIINSIIVIISYIMPLLIIGMKTEEAEFKNIFRKLLFVLNIIMIIVTITGLIEVVLKIDIYSSISKIMTPRSRELILSQKTREIYRLYSFMGHPLLNTQLYLMFFLLNNVYNKYFEKVLSIKTIIIISFIGISMTASKTGLALIGVSILLVAYQKSKLNHIVMIIVTGAVVFETGIFNNTIARLVEGSLTTGRAESWERVINSGLFPIKFFTGYGHGFTFEYNKYLDWASAAFEYPIRMFALELGTVMSILIYICIGLIPIFILIKRRHIYLLIVYLILFIDVNTYNGLALAGDYMLILSLFIFIILNMSNVLIHGGENI